jgi:hypothetical protein
MVTAGRRSSFVGSATRGFICTVEPGHGPTMEIHHLALRVYPQAAERVVECRSRPSGVERGFWTLYRGVGLPNPGSFALST